MRRDRLGLLYILISVTGYSFVAVFADGLRNAGLPPIEIAFWRYLLTAPIFIGLALSSPSPLEGQRLPRKGLLLLGCGLAIEGLCAFIGLQYLSAGIYLVLFYTYPAITAIIATILGERLSNIGWAALGVTLIGVILTIADFSLDSGSTAWIGVVCALVNAALAAVYFIAMDRMLRGHTAITRAGAYTVSGALLFLTAISGVKALTSTFVVPSGLSTWATLIGMVVISTLIPVLTMNRGIREVGPTRAAIFGTMEPLLTAVWAQMLLHQTMLPIQWLGGLLVIASVIVLQLRGAETAPESVEDMPVEPETAAIEGTV
ncbi:MAG: DMT family transporter [Anaerolineae bacterium]